MLNREMSYYGNESTYDLLTKHIDEYYIYMNIYI